MAGHPEPWRPQLAAGKRGPEEPAGLDGVVLGSVQVAAASGQSPLGKHTQPPGHANVFSFTLWHLVCFF